MQSDLGVFLCVNRAETELRVLAQVAFKSVADTVYAYATDK